MVNNVIKIISLLLLILLIIVGGLMLFDWLGLFSLREQFAPVLRLVGLDLSEGQDVLINSEDINDARLRQQLEALELERKELEDWEQQLTQRTDELNQREGELRRSEERLEQQLSALQERENLYRERTAKVDQMARNFTGMPPPQAVAQMNEMEAFLVVDILRAAERIAVEENTGSLVAFWLSLMPAPRGAEVSRLLVEKPY